MSTSTGPPPASCSITKRSGMRPPVSSTSRSLAGLASTALDGARARSPSASRTVAPTSSCTHSVPGIVERLGLELDAAQALGRGAVDDALELHDPAVAANGRRPTRRSSGAPGGGERPTRGRARSVRSVQSWTTTSPRRPWALVTRPTLSRSDDGRSVVDDVDAGLDAVLGAGHVDQRADGLGRAAPAADDPAHVVGGHVQAEAQRRRGAPRCR